MLHENTGCSINFFTVVRTRSLFLVETNMTFYTMKFQLVLVVTTFFVNDLSEANNDVHYDLKVVLNVAGFLFAQFECAQH